MFHARRLTSCLVAGVPLVWSKSYCWEPEEAKRSVGYRAVDDYARSGMTIALGTGTTTYFAVERLAEKIRKGQLKDVSIVPTSKEETRHANRCGLPVKLLSDVKSVDLMIDSANEVDAELNTIKGRTGAILWEKMAAAVAKTYVCVVDDSKLRRHLGPGYPLAVEIVPYSHEYTREAMMKLPSLARAGAKLVLRRGNISHPFPDGENIATTDNGNYIVDVYFERPIRNVETIARELDSLSGVVEHGIVTRNALPCEHFVVLVGSVNGCRAIEYGTEEEAWWIDKPEARPIDLRTIDNRQIT